MIFRKSPGFLEMASPALHICVLNFLIIHAVIMLNCEIHEGNQIRTSPAFEALDRVQLWKNS